MMTSGSDSSDRFFERWRRNFSYITGLGMSPEERQAMTADLALANCSRNKNYLMDHSPSVLFMLRHLKAAGCELPRENLFCVTCVDKRAGGFAPSGVIPLCAGVYGSQDHLESTMVHELIHMYDQCRFKVNWADLRHHACSEIRANSLSGDCRFLQDVNRGIFAFTKNHQACVRRRTVQSLMMNPACPSREAAEKAVNEVFESCFEDTRPFEEIY